MKFFEQIIICMQLTAALYLAFTGRWAEASFAMSIAIYIELNSFIKQVKDSGEE